ncbi:esterase/lipase family protein [Kitasatospora sp. NPDC004240]
MRALRARFTRPLIAAALTAGLLAGGLALTGDGEALSTAAAVGAPTGSEPPVPVAEAADSTDDPAGTVPVLASARRDGSFDPVYFLKGYSRSDNPGVNCEEYWNPLPAKMREWGSTGKFHHVAYYKGDNRNCTVRLSEGGHEVGLKDLGRELAKHIYANYSSKGQPVDLVAHSMGGLIARAALTGVQRHEDGFPPLLLVDDVVTLDTGHRGFNFAEQPWCGTKQCLDMRKNSNFLRTQAADNPQGKGGTDWTLVGVEELGPEKVDSASSLGMHAAHFVRYAGQGLDHGNLPNTTTGTYKQQYRNPPGGWVRAEQGASPGRVVANALYSSRW